MDGGGGVVGNSVHAYDDSVRITVCCHAQTLLYSLLLLVLLL